MRCGQLVIGERWHVALVIGACFLLASTCWLGWLYHLLELLPSYVVDAMTLVGGYTMQVLGTGAFVLVDRRLSWQRVRQLALVCIVAGIACLPPAQLSANLFAVLSFGLVQNVAWGFVAGFYLHLLATNVDKRDVTLVFGCSYAATTLLSWGLSVLFGGALLRGSLSVVTCCVLAVAAGVLAARPVEREAERRQDHDVSLSPSALSADNLRMTCVLAGVAVVLASMVKNAGYSFPTTDLSDGVSLEASRLLYGVGLVIAGYVNRRGRNLGALCCLTALMLPFLTLVLASNDAPGALLWDIDYLFFGFFALYRVVVWVDIAQGTGRPYLAGMGILLGRAGDVLGSCVSLALGESGLVLVCGVAVLFAVTSVSFFLLYQRLYFPVPKHEPTERELFERFAARHDLSSREREVLRLVLDERTNAEIAAELFVSQSTVKFHIRNLLRKTSCTNRRQLMAAYPGDD